MTNGFYHAKIIEPKTPKHLQEAAHRSDEKANIWFDPEFFQGKEVILFDDIVTQGHTMRDCISKLQAAGANVVRCISIGRTVSPDYNPNAIHPLTKNFVFKKAAEELAAYNARTNKTNDFRTPTTQHTTSRLNSNTIKTKSNTSHPFDSHFDFDRAEEIFARRCIRNQHNSEETKTPTNSTRPPVHNPAWQSLQKRLQPLRQYACRLRDSGKADDSPTIHLGNYKTPLLWKVVKIIEDRALLICSTPLKDLFYNRNSSKADWNSSSLKHYLNTIFLEKDFDWNERALICPFDFIWAEAHFYPSIFHEASTSDNAVFIPSQSEWIEYTKNTTPKDRVNYRKDGTFEPFWLRNTLKMKPYALYVKNDGNIDPNGLPVNHNLAVFPMIWIKEPLHGRGSTTNLIRSPNPNNP